MPARLCSVRHPQASCHEHAFKARLPRQLYTRNFPLSFSRHTASLPSSSKEWHSLVRVVFVSDCCLPTGDLLSPEATTSSVCGWSRIYGFQLSLIFFPQAALTGYVYMKGGRTYIFFFYVHDVSAGVETYIPDNSPACRGCSGGCRGYPLNFTGSISS